MAISYNEDIEVVAGTPWAIGGVLYDANDQLLDVTNCSLAWSLLNPNEAPVLPGCTGSLFLFFWRVLGLCR
jgi:hypothetical protein